MELREITHEYGEPSQHQDAKGRYVYAQEQIDKFSIEDHPTVWRGMGVPQALADSLAAGETLPLTGCTAFTFHEHIADRYSDSAWTRGKSGDDMVPMKIELERTQAFDDSLAGWHPTHDSKDGPAFEVVAGINALEILSIERTHPVSEANKRNFTAARLSSSKTAGLIPLKLYLGDHAGTLRRLEGPVELAAGEPVDEDYLDVWKAWGGKWTVDDEGIPGLAPGQVVLGRELYGLLQRVTTGMRVKARGIQE